MITSAYDRICYALVAMPSMRVELLLPLVALLSCWTGMTHAGFPEQQVFVSLVVIAQAMVVWRGLPLAAQQVPQGSDGQLNRLVWGTIFLAALQLLVMEPVFTQRVISGLCLFVFLIMSLGARRKEEVMMRVRGHDAENRTVSLLRVNACFALITFFMNEALIATASLSAWMSATVVASFMLHVAYWFTVLVMIPPEDSTEQA